MRLWSPGRKKLKKKLPVMTWILYDWVVCPYCNGNTLRVRRGSFIIWSNRKTLNNLSPEPENTK